MSSVDGRRCECGIRLFRIVCLVKRFIIVGLYLKNFHKMTKRKKVTKEKVEDRSKWDDEEDSK